MSDIKLKHASDVIQALYGDTSVPRSTTRERLTDLREEIDALLDTLDNESEKEDEALLSSQ